MADSNVTSEVEVTENGATPDAKPKTDRKMVMVGVPNAEINDLLKESARQANVSVSRLLLNFASERLGFTIPVSVRTRTSKFATSEEREAAVKASREKRALKIKTMLSIMDRIGKGEAVSQEELKAAAAL